jgi:nitroreductase
MQPPETSHPSVELGTALYGRRSVREYTSEPMTEEMIRGLIDAAVHAPSASNRQPWCFTVVRDRALLNRLSDATKAYLLAGPDGERYRERFADPTYDILHHAPALILIAAVAPGPWAVEDCALAAENLMLAAFGHGLGTCWIGYAQRYLGTDAGKRLLGLPPDCLPVAPLIVGHPAHLPAPTERTAPEVRWIG